MYLVLSKTEAAKIASRFKPDEQKMTAVGVFCLQQTRDRFATHGASSGQMWAHPKWRAQVGHDDGRAVLTGPTGSLLGSFHVSATRSSATLGSGAPQALVQQLGTVGKSGFMPDIKAKSGHSLFIPLSRKAESSILVKTARSRRERMATVDSNGKPISSSSPGAWGTLIQGKFVNGKIEPPNADFIFLKKVSLPPRPMLPDAEGERAAQGRFVTETLKS